MQPDLSIVIPTCNPQKYLWECLSSIKAQVMPHENFEIIMVLNGCKEPYLSNIQRYFATEMAGISMCLLQTDVSGVSNARNLGIDVSRGKYITFIDDDDIVSPGYLAEMYEIAESGKMPISFIQAFCEDIKKPFSYYISDNYEQYSEKEHCSILQLRKFFSTSCCKLISMDIIGSRRFDTRFQNGEDGLFMALISDRIETMSLTSRSATYFRRLRKDSLTRSQNKKEIIRNGFLLAKEFASIYCRAPFGYNLIFFTTRVAASLRKVLKALLLA